jgi:hypothetical protein
MEKEVDQTLKRSGKKEYYNILKLFCLGDLMSTFFFKGFDYGVKKLQEHPKEDKQRIICTYKSTNNNKEIMVKKGETKKKK